MSKFTAKEIRPIGEHDVKYGTRYWGYVEDSELPVSFNLMNPVDIPEGADIEFEERVIKETGEKSKNPGSEYLFLRRVKILGGRPIDKAPQGDVSSLEAKVDEILAILKKSPQTAPKSLKQQWDETTDGTTKEDVVDNDIGDEPMSLDQIPF